MAKIFGTFLAVLALFGTSAARAGFRTPESLARNVYAYYGDRSSDLSSGLRRANSLMPVCSKRGLR